MLATAGQAGASIVWGPVDTVASQSFDHLSTVTDDNGLVVAAWAGHTDHDVYIAVRKGATAWSTPTRIVTETPLVQIATGGKGAWVMWVDPPWVTVAHVAANGAVGTPTQVGAAESGYGVAVYHVSAVGTQQFRISPVTSSGQWLAAQTLPLTGFSYGVAIAPDGDALVTSRLSSGVQLVSCPEQEACGAAETNPATDRFPLTSFQDNGVINLLWGRGCLTRACYPTSLVAQRGS
jgi:hypothetical protein